MFDYKYIEKCRVSIYLRAMIKNTVLFIEPRPIDECVEVLNQYIKVIGTDTWNYVFYCGKDTTPHWRQLGVPLIVELRELDVYNFEHHSEYSDFLKRRDLWSGLSGDFVLTAQVDTWIFDDGGISIEAFLNLNKSYIGGNMECDWVELAREGINPSVKCFNGGLSLRKRLDMIRVIDSFPPVSSSYSNTVSVGLEADAEDVYFVIGCYRLGLSVGDDAISKHFALHHTWVEPFFGTHQPHRMVKTCLNELYPELASKNPYLRL
jgi:hypothetical protein